MTDAELLAKVKEGLSIVSTYNDAHLMTKTIAIKEYMLNAGITLENIESKLGLAAIVIGVTDIWDLTSGEMHFSEIFNNLITQLQVKSMPAVG